MKRLRKRLRYQSPKRTPRSKRKAVRLAMVANHERRACAAQITGNAGGLAVAALEKARLELRIMLQHPREEWFVGDLQNAVRHVEEAAIWARAAEAARQRASQHLYR